MEFLKDLHQMDIKLAPSGHSLLLAIHEITLNSPGISAALLEPDVAVFVRAL